MGKSKRVKRSGAGVNCKGVGNKPLRGLRWARLLKEHSRARAKRQEASHLLLPITYVVKRPAPYLNSTYNVRGQEASPDAVIHTVGGR